MKVYLGRHGQANSPAVDPHVALSNQGKLETESIARLLKGYHLDIVQIYHSEKLRARQTAEMIGAALGKPCQLYPPLNPSAPLEPLLNSLQDKALYIGHLPNIETIVSKLLIDRKTSLITFIPSTVICLENVNGKWLLNWAVSPELVRQDRG